MWNYRDSFWCFYIVTIQYFFKSTIFGCISYCQTSEVWTEYIYTWYKIGIYCYYYYYYYYSKIVKDFNFLCLAEQGWQQMLQVVYLLDWLFFHYSLEYVSCEVCSICVAGKILWSTWCFTRNPYQLRFI